MGNVLSRFFYPEGSINISEELNPNLGVFGNLNEELVVCRPWKARFIYPLFTIFQNATEWILEAEWLKEATQDDSQVRIRPFFISSLLILPGNFRRFITPYYCHQFFYSYSSPFTFLSISFRLLLCAFHFYPDLL